MTSRYLLLLLGIILSVGLVFGQDNCPLLVERALQSVNDNCSDMDRNTACYAYNQVQATFLRAVADDFFTQPSDRTDLTYLDTLHTTALDEENDRWGIAMMSVQANVPNTLPGQAVVFMLMGDAQIENRVAPDEAFEPSDPVTVTTLVASSNIRLAPVETGYVLGTVPLETEFEADGLSADGQWVRIIFDDQPAWIYRNLISSEARLDALPIISNANRTPMQAFYFSTGTGVSTCNEAPDSLMIQGPDALEVQINANGIDINIGSTIMLQFADENTMNITAINGYAEVGNIRVPGGFTIDAITDAQGTIQPETLSGLRPMSDEQIERYKSIEKVESEVMNYQVHVMSRAEINMVQTELEAGQRRENFKQRCIEAGLSQEQCIRFVGSDSDQQTIYERCVTSGLTARQCRNAIGTDGDTGAENGIELGTLAERCRQAGFQSLDDCRNEYAGESDARIEICTALGYNSRQRCRDAYPEDAIDKVINCVSRGFATKAECDASDSGATSEDTVDDSAPEQNECERRGLTSAQCRRARRYRECRDRGYSAAYCRALSSR